MLYIIMFIDNLFIFIYLYIFLCCVACEILVLGPGLVLVPPALEMQGLNLWTAGEVPLVCACVCEHSAVPMDYSLSDSSVHGIFQVRILEWVAPGDIPNPGIEPMSPSSAALAPGTLFLRLNFPLS